MSHPLAPALKIFAHNGWMLRNAVTDLTPEQGTFSLDGKTNSYLRIVGHIVVSRHGLATLVGVTMPLPDWGDFGKFKLAAQFDEANVCPPLDELMEVFANVTEALNEALLAMTTDQLSAPSPMPVPGDDPDMMDLVAFFAMHESYHIGQLGVLSRVLGRGRIMGA